MAKMAADSSFPRSRWERPPCSSQAGFIICTEKKLECVKSCNNVAPGLTEGQKFPSHGCKVIGKSDGTESDNYKDLERTEIRRELSKNNHRRRQGPHRAHCLDVPRDVCANNIPRVFGRQRSAIPIIIGQNLPNQIFPPPAKTTKIVGGHTRHLAPGLFWGINTSMETWKTANAVHSAIVCVLAHVKLPSSNFSNASRRFVEIGLAKPQYDTYPLSSTSTPLAGSMSHISRHNLSCASLMLELVAYVLLSITLVY